MGTVTPGPVADGDRFRSTWLASGSLGASCRTRRANLTAESEFSRIIGLHKHSIDLDVAPGNPERFHRSAIKVNS
jgi:hypothetical protein